MAQLIYSWSIIQLKDGERLKLQIKEQKIDYARLLKKLVDDYYPEAWVITVVQDNLNTHTPKENLDKVGQASLL